MNNRENVQDFIKLAVQEMQAELPQSKWPRRYVNVAAYLIEGEACALCMPQDKLSQFRAAYKEVADGYGEFNLCALISRFPKPERSLRDTLEKRDEKTIFLYLARQDEELLGRMRAFFGTGKDLRSEDFTIQEAGRKRITESKLINALKQKWVAMGMDKNSFEVIVGVGNFHWGAVLDDAIHRLTLAMLTKILRTFPDLKDEVEDFMMEYEDNWSW
jgi:hypothetical protein